MPMTPRKNADSSRLLQSQSLVLAHISTFIPPSRLRQLLSTSTSDNTSDPSLTKFVHKFCFTFKHFLMNHIKVCWRVPVWQLRQGLWQSAGSDNSRERLWQERGAKFSTNLVFAVSAYISRWYAWKQGWLHRKLFLPAISSFAPKGEILHPQGWSFPENQWLQLIFIFRKLKEGQRPKASSYDKFMDIELSSPLGRFDNMVYN